MALSRRVIQYFDGIRDVWSRCSCNILWFSTKFPGCSIRFIGDHNCVTPHCFPKIESEEEFNSDQDRPGGLLADLTDYAIIIQKIKIKFT